VKNRWLAFRLHLEAETCASVALPFASGTRRTPKIARVIPRRIQDSWRDSQARPTPGFRRLFFSPLKLPDSDASEKHLFLLGDLSKMARKGWRQKPVVFAGFYHEKKKASESGSLAFLRETKNIRQDSDCSVRRD
jgi:hypothetical protein